MTIALNSPLILMPAASIISDLSGLSDDAFRRDRTDLLSFYGGTRSWVVNWPTNELALLIPGPFRFPSDSQFASLTAGAGSSPFARTQKGLKAAGNKGLLETSSRRLAETTLERILSEGLLEDPFATPLNGQLARELFPNPDAALAWIQEMTEYAYLEKGSNLSREVRDELQWYLMDSAEMFELLGDHASQSLQYVAWLTERLPLLDLPLELLPFVFCRIRPCDLTAYAEMSHREDLRKLAAYYAASLPWERTFWLDYLASQNPETYLKEMFEKVQPWRHGRRLDDVNDENLRWAYAGLDHPWMLPFDCRWDRFSFKRSFPNIRPEAPFLDHPFSAEVRLRQSNASVTVDFLPSSSEADSYMGHVSEVTGDMVTINDGQMESCEEILRQKDFQFYRMIAEGRLVGVLYLEQIEDDAKGIRQLIVSLHPRTFWEVDLESLLDAVEGPLTEIREHKGYDRVLLSAGYCQSYSVHDDPLVESMERRYSRPAEKIGGIVFAQLPYSPWFKKENLFILP